MGKRRRAREIALKVLYEMEYNEDSYEDVVQRLVTEERLEAELAEFLNQLLSACTENRQSIDTCIEGRSEHWKLSRMPSVDRNLLRLGMTELIYIADIPKSVTINEYLEIAKRYGTEDSSSFINGILDKFEKPV